MACFFRITSLTTILLLCGCTSSGITLNNDAHLVAPSPAPPRTDDKALIPPALEHAFSLPPPKSEKQPETYTVVVNHVSAQSLLFALARDAKLNLDIHPAVTGVITLNAIDQTLLQLLSRISRQIDIRYELDGQNLIILPDHPFIEHYKIDYVNLARETSSIISVASQIGSGNSGKTELTQPQSSSGSFARIQNSSNNRFWASLIQNLTDLVQESQHEIGMPDPGCSGPRLAESAPRSPSPSGSKNGPETSTQQPAPSAPALAPCTTSQINAKASVMANVETGVVSIRANTHQHARVQAFLDKVLNRARRQVLIEATIAEVELTQNYQQGIDWSALNVFDSGFRYMQRTVGAFTGINSIPAVELGYDSSGGNFTSAVKLLETFGTVKVLSSPKLSVLNNQTAVMKVVDDNVYFTYEVKETDATSNSPAKTTINSTLHSVPVGLVLTITPMIGDDGSVTLNIRPSMSRVIGQKTDPSLQFLQGNATITNTIPIIRAREFDSVMRISNGNIAIMGGLMEDALENNDNAVPVLAKIPGIGHLFENRNDTKRKTELVIFVRPTVVRDTNMPERLATLEHGFSEHGFFETNTAFNNARVDRNGK